MITNYSEKRPQSQIFQNREIVSDTPISRSNAFIFGPGYKLVPVDADGEEVPNTTDAKFDHTIAKALDFDLSAKFISISSIEDITSNFGPIRADNPLAFACSLCLSSGEGKRVYASPIPSAAYTVTGVKSTEEGKTTSDVSATIKVSEDTKVEQDAYEKVLTKLSANNNIQFICPLTTNINVHDACKTHCVTMSTSEIQRWRRTYCTLKSTSTTAEDVVADIVNSAKKLDSDRAIAIWVDSPKYVTVNSVGGIEEQPLDPIYVTAGIVGLRAAALPQQGLSMQELGFISSAPLMYTKYTKAELDQIAANGVLIVTQDGDEEEVYIRHQLTTQTEKGVMYYEDSIGVNLDNISYQVKDIIRGYIGKRNITPATLVELKNKFYELLTGLTITPLGQAIGPQIISILEGSIVCRIDPYIKDRVNLSATVELPLPLNSLFVYLNSVVLNSAIETA